MRTRIVLLLCLSLQSVDVRQGIAQDQPTDAAASKGLLRSRGLVEEGHAWLTKREAAYKRTADSLDHLERRHQQALSKATDALARNEQIRTALAAAEEAERTQKKLPQPATAGPTAGRRTPDVKETDGSEKLKSTMVDVTGQGEQTLLQLAMIELASARVAAQLALLDVIHNGKSIDADYETLRADSRIKLAIQKIDKAKLGPARNYQRDMGRAQALAPAVFASEIPCFFESGQFRTIAILNEAQPVTMSIEAGDQPVRITASVAQRLGIVPSGDPRELRIGERNISVRPVVLNSLRLGPALLRNVSALVLPPEAEDLGSWVSTGTLAGWNAARNERGMSLVLSPKAP